MKTYNIIKIVALLACMALVGCGGKPTPIINSKAPFIVDEIKSYGKGGQMSIYTARGCGSGVSYGNELLISNSAAIVLPTGWFQINDTIRFDKPIRK